MLSLKSRHSFRSTGPDRLATARANQLPGLAKDRGWDFAMLADERSMAGALEFLASARHAGIRAAAGIQVTELTWRGRGIGLVLMPLDQTGLRRLVAAADGLAAADKLEAVIRGLGTGVGGQVDVTAFLMPGRDITSASDDDLARLRADLLEAGLGPVTAQVEAGTDRAELHHAPWSAAQHMHVRGGIALARLTMGYAPDDLSEAFQEGLVALATDNADKNAAKAASRRPRMPARIGIPARDAAAEAEPAATVATAIAARVEGTTLNAKPTLPARLGLAAGEAADDTLRSLARRGLADLVARGRASKPDEAAGRLERELAVITRMGFSNYFLVVREAVGFARRNGIPVGPGRGSVAGSMAAYALGLTAIDPIRHRLLFERFINPDRISLPDIDTDFCEDRRHEVIAHLAATYGDEHVAHISTYASNKPRGAVRTAGRILNLAAAAVRLMSELEARLGKVRGLEEDALNHRTTAVIEQIAAESEDPDVKRLAALSTTFLGIASNQGIHAGGVVLGDEPIRTRLPLHAERTEHGRLAVQTDMHSTEACGLVKFDLLGVTTLTIIADCVAMLAAHGIAIDIGSVPEDDAAVFEMIRRGRTRTIFQLERGGISQAAREIAVDSFDDIVALVALYRPGPMAHIQTYAARKRGASPVSYPAPCMEATLADTHGIIVFQEQVMQIAQDFAGYSLAEADILRKAIGKKNAKLLESQHAAFVDKAVAAGQPRDLAEEVFAFVVPFAEYGFNRSHAAAYATVTYQTAWLKHHHPAEWHAACATRKSKPEERARVIADADQSGVDLVLPDVNLSQADFATLRRPGAPAAIVVPLRAVDGTRAESIEAILRARASGGPFRSFVHLLSTTDSSTDTTIEALVRVGACDSLTKLPPTIARPHFERLLGQPQHRTEKARDARQVDLLAAAAPTTALEDPEPRLWPQDPSGIKAMAPEEAIAIQQRLLKGMIDHQGGQMRTTGWLREIEGLLDLASAEKVAAKTATRSLATLVSMGEREHAGGDGRRVLQATVEDDGHRRTYDIAPGTTINPDLPTSKGRVVHLTLQPSPHEAFIADRPIIGLIELCGDPLAATPPPYPIIHLDEEIGDGTREALRRAQLDASREHRRARRNGDPPATYATHALLVPPSREIEALELTAAVRALGPAKVFGGLEAVAQIVQ